MRERRHLSGNSNRVRPVSAVPTCTDHSATSEHVSSPRSPQERTRRGCATARGTPSEMVTAQRASKRRIQSARGPRTASAGPLGPPEALPRLPQVAPFVVSAASSSQPVQWAVRTTTQTPLTPTTEVPPHVVVMLADFRALLREHYEGKRSMRRAFLNCDHDKDGELSAPEVREMIHSLGLAPKLGRENVEDLVHHLTSNPSDRLQYDAFCTFIYGDQNDSKPPKEAAASTNASDKPTTRASTDSLDVTVDASDRALYPDVEHVLRLLRTKYQQRKFREVFRHWDADKDGGVNRQELDQNLRQLGVKLPSAQLQELFGTFDRDHDGRLRYHEFIDMISGPVAIEHHNPALQARLRDLAQREPTDAYQILRNGAIKNPIERIDEEAICAAVQEKLTVFAPRIHDAYLAFDQDHSGNLSYHEFRQGLSELGLHFTEREFLHLAALADTDGDGEISFREFSTMFHRPRRRAKGKNEKDPTASHAEDEESRKEATELSSTQRERLSHGTFDFSHLTRRVKIPTRHGRTPQHDTINMLREDSLMSDHSRFSTETQIYGSGQPLKTRGGAYRQDARDVDTRTTIGQSEKQLRDASYTKRLERIRQQQQTYEERTAPMQHTHDEQQQRRVESLQRHQQRYQQSIDQQQRHTKHPLQ